MYLLLSSVSKLSMMSFFIDVCFVTISSNLQWWIRLTMNMKTGFHINRGLSFFKCLLQEVYSRQTQERTSPFCREVFSWMLCSSYTSQSVGHRSHRIHCTLHGRASSLNLPVYHFNSIITIYFRLIQCVFLSLSCQPPEAYVLGKPSTDSLKRTKRVCSS